MKDLQTKPKQNCFSENIQQHFDNETTSELMIQWLKSLAFFLNQSMNVNLLTFQYMLIVFIYYILNKHIYLARIH